MLDATEENAELSLSFTSLSSRYVYIPIYNEI